MTQALLHMLKAEAWPLSPATPGWQAEARRFRDDAASRFPVTIDELLIEP